MSVFSNLFENIREAAQNGERRYKLRNHVLVFGADRRVEAIVRAINEQGDTAVVMATEKPELSDDLTFIFYKGRRDAEADVLSARPDHAKAIYIIGEENESDHDNRSLQCLDILTEASQQANHNIRCFLTLRDYASTEVFQYLKTKPMGRLLLVDTINDYEYMAEQLLVDTHRAFTPVIRQGDSSKAHFIIIGTGPMAQAVAYTAAHICHYANYTERGTRTRITFIAKDMEQWRDHLMASRPALFALSHTTFVSNDGTVTDSLPQGDDFMDVEWQFVDADEHAPLARHIMEEQTDKATRIIVCHDDADRAVNAVLHLPRKVYPLAKVAVSMTHENKLIDRAKCMLIQYLGMTEEQAHRQTYRDLRTDRRHHRRPALRTPLAARTARQLHLPLCLCREETAIGRGGMVHHQRGRQILEYLLCQRHAPAPTVLRPQRRPPTHL